MSVSREDRRKKDETLWWCFYNNGQRFYSAYFSYCLSWGLYSSALLFLSFEIFMTDTNNKFYANLLPALVISFSTTHLHTEKINTKRSKIKLSRYRHAGSKRDSSYSSYSFLNSALDGGEWSVSRPGRALPPGEDPTVPTRWEAG
jgi:hypothetical protein